MVIEQEWAGVKVDLGWTGTKLKGLPSWACAWGMGDDGRFAFMEIWRESGDALFVGRVRHLGDVGSVAEHFSDTVKRKRAAGYLPVAFEDKHRGAVPSFSGGEGVRIAAAGAGDGGAQAVQWGKKLSLPELERALLAFGERVGQSWTGASNAKVLLAELRQIKQRVEVFCEAQEDPAACEQLRAQLETAKRAVQQVLLA